MIDLAWALRRLQLSRRALWRPGIISWLICLCWSFAPAFAHYHFDSWTADTGLPQNSVNAILQTRDGYLWLTTSDGLARFDGVRFTVFDRNSSPGIGSNYLTSLYEDAKGALWIGAENNHILRYENGKFRTYTMSGLPAGDYVHSISGDKSGGLWVSMKDRVMHREDEDRFSPLLAKGFPEQGSYSVRIVERENRAGFWTFGPAGLSIFVAGRVTTWTHNDGLPKLAIQAVTMDKHGSFWLAMHGALWKIQDGSLKKMNVPQSCLAKSDLNFVSGPVSRLVCFIDSRTLSLINLESGEEQKIAPVPAEFPRNIKSAVFYEDREGNLWIGTASQGLYRARKQVVAVYSRAQGLRDRNVYTVLEDHTGAIWLGTWPSTLSKFEHGAITNYTEKDGLSSEQITSLYEDRAGHLWVGAYGPNGNGLRVFRDGRFVQPDKLRNLGLVKAILQDRRGVFWFGTEDRLVSFDKGLSTSYTTKDGLASNDVRVLIEDVEDGIWIGGYGGLTRFQSGKFTAYTEGDGLPSSNVRSLYQDPQSVLWIGTYDGGLGRFKDGRFTRYTVRNGLFNNGVFQILEDGYGNLWMSSNRGIHRVNKSDLNNFAAGNRTSIPSVSYGKSDGMLNVECNGGHWPAGAKARDGRLWFATQDGAAVIDPLSVTPNAVPPTVIIESCLIDRANVALDGVVRVKPGQDDLEIRYTALSLINSDRIQFRYMLKGLDSKWVDAGTRRTAYYSHVPAGDYVFTVMAANSDGVWNSVGQTLSLAVESPYYRSWWFTALVMLFAGAMLVFGWQYRVAEWKRTHAAQLVFSRRLIISQESERKRIAAELHDSLGQSLAIIKTRALLTLNEPENQRRVLEQLDEIAQGAAHSMDELKEIAYNLRPFHLERLGLRKSIQAMLNQIAHTGGLQVKAEIDPLDPLSSETQINIYRMVQESANNIVKHAAATEAQVTIRRGAGEVEIVIADNGKGFAQENVGISQTPNSGFGLISIAERARVLGGNLAIESVPGRGTTLRIRVALEQGSVC